MSWIINVNLGTGNVNLVIDKDSRKNILELANNFNKSANELANFFEEISSNEDKKKFREFFGEIMGVIISEIIIPTENIVDN